MVPVRDDVNLGLIGITLDDKGWPTAELYQKRATAMIDELLWWTRITQEGRAKDPR
jgi:hypothetical protein